MCKKEKSLGKFLKGKNKAQPTSGKCILSTGTMLGLQILKKVRSQVCDRTLQMVPFGIIWSSPTVHLHPQLS